MSFRSKRAGTLVMAALCAPLAMAQLEVPAAEDPLPEGSPPEALGFQLPMMDPDKPWLETVEEVARYQRFLDLQAQHWQTAVTILQRQREAQRVMAGESLAPPAPLDATVPPGDVLGVTPEPAAPAPAPAPSKGVQLLELFGDQAVLRIDGREYVVRDGTQAGGYTVQMAADGTVSLRSDSNSFKINAGG